jgi:hypothetical protein
MNQKYTDWVSEHWGTPDKSFGQCASAVIQMQQAFPELRIVKGHYYCPIWGKRAHWWCKDPEEHIADPTASQFPSFGIGEYEEANPKTLVEVSVCYQCGKPIRKTLAEIENNPLFIIPTFCSSKCEALACAELNAMCRYR